MSNPQSNTDRIVAALAAIDEKLAWICGRLAADNPQSAFGTGGTPATPKGPCKCSCGCGRGTAARKNGGFFDLCYQCGQHPEPGCTRHQPEPPPPPPVPVSSYDPGPWQP